MSDPGADPFAERGGRVRRRRYWLLGAQFTFESASTELLRLVDAAFAKLPAHRLPAAPRCRVRLVLSPARGGAAVPAAPRLSSGAGFLCAVMDADNFAVVAPRAASALVQVARATLRHAYHVRYELIEFAVQTLAARAAGLVPLHAAALARARQGVLLMGDSGAGKSTLCLHGLLGGLDLVSEDSVFVSADDLSMTGLPTYLHLRADSRVPLPREALAALRGSPIIRRRSGVAKREIDARGRFGLAPRPPRLRAVVFLSAHRALPPLRHLTQEAARRRMRALQPYGVASEAWSRFERALRGVACYELRRAADPAAGVEELRRLLAPSRHG